MKAIDIYRKYRSHGKLSKALLDRLETLLPYKRYIKIKNKSDALPEGDEEPIGGRNLAKNWKPE